MTLIVDVKLWSENVGSLIWNGKLDIAAFQYDSKFLRSKLDISPIMMPLKKSSEERVYQFPSNRSACFGGLPGLIADSLPDKFGTQIINEWFATRGLPNEQITPLDRLCYVGKRGMGALEFEPCRNFSELESSTIIHVEELTKLADSIFSNRNSFQEKLIQENKTIIEILKVGTSAGGAKPKAIIAYNDMTGEVRSGQVKAPEGFTYWLLKFDGTTYSEHDKITNNPKGIGNIEYAYYRMAKDSGIEMMESRLLTENDYSHFMTKRFDRLDNGEKLHVQTLAGISHYDRDTRHSYEEAFGIMRKMKLDYPQMEELYRRMVFNVVSRNHDDHTKNFSFLMDRQGKWQLAPAYDLCYSYSPSRKWTNRHQMSLNGKQENFTYQDLIDVAKNTGINKPDAIIEKTVETVSRWMDYAKDCGVKESHARQIKENLILLSGGFKAQPEQTFTAQELELIRCIDKKDYTTLSALKEKGYSLSPKVLEHIGGDKTLQIAVRKIFGLPEQHEKIELAHSNAASQGIGKDREIQ